jgi:hypothetical protein
MKRLLAICLTVFFTLASCGPCAIGDQAAATPSLSGKSMVGKITSGTGLFAPAAGKKFTTHFDKNGHFKSVTPKDKTTTEGTFTYKRQNADEGRIELNASSGENAGESVLVVLTFTEKNTGVYEARLTKGGWGEETGTFEIKE